MGVNIYKAINISEYIVATGDFSQVDELLSIDDKNRPSYMAKLDREGLTKMLSNYRSNIIRELSIRSGDDEEYVRENLEESSTANTIGADARYVSSKGEVYDIEMKFGKATDKAPSAKKLLNVSDDLIQLFDDYINTQTRVFNRDHILKWYYIDKIIDTASIDEWNYANFKQIEEAINSKNIVFNGSTIIDEKDGTTFKNWFEGSGNGLIEGHNYIRFQMTDKHGNILIKEPNSLSEDFKVSAKLFFKEGDRPRLHIYFTGDNYMVDCVFHNKVSSKNSQVVLDDGNTYLCDNRFFLNSPCFNCWVKNINE